MNRMAVIPFSQPWKSSVLVRRGPLNGFSPQFHDLSIRYSVRVIGLRMLKSKRCRCPKRSGLFLATSSNLSPETRLHKALAVVSAPAPIPLPRFLDPVCNLLLTRFLRRNLFSAFAKRKRMLPVTPALSGDIRPYHYFTAPALTREYVDRA